MKGFPVMLEVVRVELLVGGAVPHPGPGPGHGEGKQAADARCPGGDQAPVPALLTITSVTTSQLLNRPSSLLPLLLYPLFANLVCNALSKLF